MAIDHLVATFVAEDRATRVRGGLTAMLGWLAMILQAALPGDVSPAAPASRTSVLPAPCPTQPGDDIVVCGRPDAQDSYRLRTRLDTPVEDRQFRLRLPGGSEITPHAGQGRYGDVQATVTLKVPF